jgi:hypothetical protein
VLKPKYLGKTANHAFILLPHCHRHHLLSGSIKIESGIELIDDFLITIILKAHFLCHLKLITSGLDLVKDWVLLHDHPLPIHLLGWHHWSFLVKVDRVVPIRMEKRPKPRVHGLLAAFLHRSFTVGVDSVLLCPLGVPNGIVITTLLGSMPLIELTLIMLLVIGVRGVVTWLRRRRPTRHSRLAWTTLLAGPGHILLILGSFLTTWVHPEIRDIEIRLSTRDGYDRTKYEEVNQFLEKELLSIGQVQYWPD